MAITVSQFVVGRLRAWGVRRVYGYPGDGINGVMGALAQAGGAIDFVQARHEEMAAFMACGHAKHTGEAGVCMATGGPGAIHVLNGLYDAKADNQPVVAIVGQSPRRLLGTQHHQEVDLPALFKDACSEYVQMVTTAAQVRHAVDRAFRIALSGRCPTAIILPADVQEEEVPMPSRARLPQPGTLSHARPRIVPAESELARAAAVLDAGERVAMLVGAGAAGAGDEVVALAGRLGAGVATALFGRGVVSSELPYVTGCIGLLGTRPTHEMMAACDTLLMVGTNFPFAEFLPEEGQARVVQVDIDARRLGMRHPVDVALHGDSRETLRALLPRVREKGERARAWRAKLEAGVRKWEATLAERAKLPADPINPQAVFRELSGRLPDDAMIATDTGSSVFWFARHVRARPGQTFTHSGLLASMGAAIPYAIAGKFAWPDRPAVALVGDGAMQMSGMNELITVARNWRRWRDPRFVVLVLNNRDLAFVSWEQRVLEGNARFGASQDVPDFSYARFAEMLGLRGLRLEAPGEVAGAWEAAFASDRPFVLEAIVDPDVPMLPPHITLEQARNYLKALLKGDPDAARRVRASLKDFLA